jgi:hypothetical protein
VLRSIKLCSKAYDAIVEVFGLGDMSRLQAEIAAGTMEFSAVCMMLENLLGTILIETRTVTLDLFSNYYKTFRAFTY